MGRPAIILRIHYPLSGTEIGPIALWFPTMRLSSYAFPTLVRAIILHIGCVVLGWGREAAQHVRGGGECAGRYSLRADPLLPG
eukprot:847239-Rhodomonas_salina.5